MRFIINLNWGAAVTAIALLVYGIVKQERKHYIKERKRKEKREDRIARRA